MASTPSSTPASQTPAPSTRPSPRRFATCVRRAPPVPHLHRGLPQALESLRLWAIRQNDCGAGFPAGRCGRTESAWARSHAVGFETRSDLSRLSRTETEPASVRGIPSTSRRRRGFRRVVAIAAGQWIAGQHSHMVDASHRPRTIHATDRNTRLYIRGAVLFCQHGRRPDVRATAGGRHLDVAASQCSRGSTWVR